MLWRGVGEESRVRDLADLVIDDLVSHSPKVHKLNRAQGEVSSTRIHDNNIRGLDAVVSHAQDIQEGDPSNNLVEKLEHFNVGERLL